MKHKKEVGKSDSVPNMGLETPSGKGVDTVSIMMTDTETPAVGKGKKLGIKRVKKPDTNISKGKLKSVNTPKNFSFLNMSVQKQTLRANNRALAQNLAKARQDIRQLNTEIQTLRSQNQEQCLELNRLKRLVGLKDEEIQQEVQQRIQDEMKGMQHLLEELTQSMMQSSTYITKMNDKCLSYCSRRSTDSSRSVSLESNRGNHSLNKSSSRSAFKDLGSKEDLMAMYLSKADEFTAPPGSRIFNDNSNEADMSIIAEQSILDSNDDIYAAHPLTSVEETVSEVSPVDTLAPPKALSKLPQRVLKYADTAKPNTKSNSVESASTSSEKSTESIDELGKIEKSEKVVNSRSKSSKTKELQSGKCKETEKINNVSSLKTKSTVNDQCKVVKKQTEQNGKQNELDTKEHELDPDISAFGFGGNFAADLVSGSPIAAEKRQVTFVMSKKSEVTESTSIETEKRTETFVKPKGKEISENKSSRKEENRKQRETFVLPKVPSQVKSKEKKESKKVDSMKINVSHTEKNRKKDNSEKVSLKTKEKRRETYATDNPFVSKKAKVHRSPVKQVNEENTVYDSVTDPFRPTKTLARSPVHISIQSATPEKKVDSLAFLAKFRESLENKPVESSPLPDPDIPDEPTTYFNSEMEFTSVIDSTKLLQSLSRSQKNSPDVPIKEISEPDSMINANKCAKVNEAPKLKESGKAGYTEQSDAHQEVSEGAAVEVRTKKPGVFTFSVARKEADGTRKAVPEKVSKARSKKKRPVTPEKEERMLGPDRDMFNFGDRTPTMPLEKLAKTKNVYDLSMNESLAAPLVSLKNFNDKEQLKSTQTKSQDPVYYVPLKGSSEEEPVSKHARSQSRSRSKSRKADDDDDDEDWVPGGKSRARSKSRGRQGNDEETTRRRGRSQSRKRVVDDSQTDEKENTLNEKSRARSRSRSIKVETEESTQRPCRSRSRARTVNYDENTIEGDEEETYSNKESKSVSERSSCSERLSTNLGRSKTRKDRGDSKDEVDSNEQERSGRSRSRARSKVENPKVCSEVSENIAEPAENTLAAPRRSTRSKSQVRKPVLDDEEEDIDKSPEIQRKSRSIHRRKTYEIKAEDENKTEKDNNETEKVLASKAKKPLIEPELFKTGPVIVVPDSDDSESKEKEDSEDSKTVSKHKNTVSSSERETVEESESDSESVKKIEKLRRKSRRRAKSVRYIENEFENDIESYKNANNSEHLVSSNTKNDTKRASRVSVADIESNDIDNNTAFINKRRGKSMRILDDDDLDKVIGLESGNVNTEKEILINSDHAENRSPKVCKKTEEKRATKSVKKSTKKRKPEDADADPKVRKSKQNIAEKMDRDESTKDNETTKSSVTPAVVPDVSRKSAKTSRTGKSAKKVRAEHLPDQTPVSKEDKMTNQIADKPNALALLKKRLTMVGTKHAAHEDLTSDEQKSRKRSKEELDQHQSEGCETPENKRSRRNKNPVSYVTKPLNVKLRQGDQMFQDALMSKVKAEQSRLAIAKKMSVPKISRDDKENIVQT